VTRPRRTRAAKPSRSRQWIVRVLVVAAVFVIGVALGAALDDNPEPGTTTFDRTLTVVTLTATP
jgi:hypothetical protein